MAASRVAAAYSSAAALQEQQLFDLAIAEWRALIAASDAAAAGDAAGGAAAEGAIVGRARYNLGVCLFQTADYAAAATQFAAVADAEAFPKLAEPALANLGLARFNLARGREAEPQRAAELYRGAADALQQLLSRYPQSPQAPLAWYYRGESAAALAQHDEAVAAFSQLVQRHPESPFTVRGRIGVATASLALGRADAAEQAISPLLDTASVLDTAAPMQQIPPALRREAFRLRGEARLAAERYADAASDFARVAAPADDATDGPRPAGQDEAQQRQAYCLYRAGKYRAAADVYDLLAAGWPESEFAQGAGLSAAKCLMAAGENAAAAGRLLGIWRANPAADNLAAAHWLARASVQAGTRPADAPADANAAAAIANNRKRLEAAVAAVDEAIAIAARQPRRPVDSQNAAAVDRAGERRAWPAELALDRGDLLYNLPDKRRQAAEAYAQAAAQHPGTPPGALARRRAAQAMLELGENERAAALATAALTADAEAGAGQADMLQVLAAAEQAAGNTDAAIAALRRLTTEHADDARLGAWAQRLAVCLAASAESDSEAGEPLW
ncbi:MAG: tetratricopeptide repeat protein, partial [Planctomycetota bacterium]